jgi:hypothetical protein
MTNPLAATPSCSSRRSALRALGSCLGGSLLVPAAWAQAPEPAAANVLDFGADPSGKHDSTPAFAKALARNTRVRVPSGEYLVGDLDLRAGTSLEGSGESSILRQRAGAHRLLHADSGSADPAANLNGIRIAKLQLRGNCDTAGFSEFVHLVSLNGVTDARIDEVVFRGFQGDGLYLGSSDQAKTERHNRQVTVTNCVFDGINRQNRNGISVIDCDGLLVTGCTFRHVARSNMPGAIDIEPDANAWHVVRNLRIVNNQFLDVGGGIGAVCMYVPVALKQPASDILIEGNQLQDIAQAAFCLMQGVPVSAQASQRIVVRGNRVQGDFQRPFILKGVSGVEVADNLFDGATQAALVGFREPWALVRHLNLHDNVFQHCGRVGGVAVAVFSVSDLQVQHNEFKDCGNGSSTSYVFDFNAGTSDNVRFIGNRFLSPEGRTRFAIQAEPSHRFVANTNVFDADNELAPGLRNKFEAAGSH